MHDYNFCKIWALIIGGKKVFPPGAGSRELHGVASEFKNHECLCRMYRSSGLGAFMDYVKTATLMH